MCRNSEDLLDGTPKKSMFIGYVNKLRSNYSNLQPNVLMNLFITCCCSFCRSILWKFCSNFFS